MNPLTLSADQLKQTPTEEFGDERLQEIHHFLVGGGGYWEIFPERSRTLRACWEVLCRLPNETADGLMYGSPSVVFAPAGVWGWARPWRFPGTFRPVDDRGTEYSDLPLSFVYLSPEIEDIDDRALVGVIAHELAHIVIGDIVGTASEVQADELVRHWGFNDELDRIRELNPHHRY